MGVRTWWILLVILASGPATLVAQVRAPIIDMHMHARRGSRAGVDGNPLGPPCAPQPCPSPKPPMYVGEGAVLRGTLAMMEKYNILKGFIGDSDEDVDVWVRAAPDRFIRSSGIPQSPWDSVLPSLQKLREGYRSGRLKGMGEIGTQMMGIAPNDPRLEPYFALAEGFDVPVLIHTAGQGAPIPSYRVAAGRPLLLEDVVKRHPKLRLYFENAGYPFLEDAIALMSQYPQVYADVSTITWIIPREAFYRYMRALVDAGLGERLMYGSDQMEWPEVIGRGIEAIEAAPFLTAQQKRNILYNNAARFLRLDEKVSRSH